MPIAKKTSKNQITLPRSVVSRFPGVDYFDVREAGGEIVLRPVHPDRAEDVRRKLAELGIFYRRSAAGPTLSPHPTG